MDTRERMAVGLSLRGCGAAGLRFRCKRKGWAGGLCCRTRRAGHSGAWPVGLDPRSPECGRLVDL